MYHFYGKILGVVAMGGAGVSVMGNAWKPYYPNEMQFFGADDPIIGALLLINAAVLGYAYSLNSEELDPKDSQSHTVVDAKRYKDANKAYLFVGIVLLLMGLGLMIAARKQDETLPLAWMSYFAMLCAGGYFAWKGGESLYQYDESPLIERFKSRIVRVLYPPYQARVDEKRQSQQAIWAREERQEKQSSSWFDGWF